MSVLQLYKSFVREHPSLVLNIERLLRWIAWNPERFSGSEFAYEGWNAAVGLLGLYNQSILTEGPGSAQDSWALALAALQEVQTLVELRAIHLEQQGKMSRYGPLIVLELARAALRLRMWRQSGCTLALDSLTQEDQAQVQSEQQLQELLQALMRLRGHYSCSSQLAAAKAPASASCKAPQQQQHTTSDASQAAAAAPGATAAEPAQPPSAWAISSSSRSSSVAGSKRQGAAGVALQPLRPAAAGAISGPGGFAAQQQGPGRTLQQQQQQQQQLLQPALGLAWSGGGRSAQRLLTGSELLFVLRPLVYCCLLRRYGLGSWRPWLASLGLELASSYGLQAGAALQVQQRAHGWPGGPACSTLYSLALLRGLSSGRWSAGEAQELLGRRLQLLRYLLRSPCYDVATRRLLQRLVAGVCWLPGLSQLAEFGFQMVESMQSYYTYVEG